MIVSSIYMICFSIAIFLWGYVIRKNNSTYGIFFYDNAKYEKDIFCKIISKYFFLIGVSYFVYSVLTLLYSEIILSDEIIKFIYELLISFTLFIYIILCLIEINSRALSD